MLMYIERYLSDIHQLVLMIRQTCMLVTMLVVPGCSNSSTHTATIAIQVHARHDVILIAAAAATRQKPSCALRGQSSFRLQDHQQQPGHASSCIARTIQLHDCPLTKPKPQCTPPDKPIMKQLAPAAPLKAKGSSCFVGCLSDRIIGKYL